MSGLPKAEPIVFHAHVTPAERAVASREFRLLGLRMLVAALPLVCFELWPMREWLELVNGRPVPIHLPAFLVGFTSMLPAMFLYQALRTACSQSTRGTRYTLDDVGIRWSDNFRLWKFVRAFYIERDRRGTPERLTLLFKSDRTRAIRLPIDDDASVDRIIAFIADRVPSHDDATHGPLDPPDALPGRTIASLVIVSIVGLSLAAMHGQIERDATKATLRLIFAGSAIVPAVWYAIVRRSLNRVQREQAVVHAIVVGMTLFLAALCVVIAPQARKAVRDLRAIPADVRERIGRTITTRSSDSE